MINSKKISLDRVRRGDLEFLLAWRNDPAVWRWCRQHDLIHEDSHKRWFEWQSNDDSVSMYTIKPVGYHTPVGVCGFTSIDSVHRRAEFSCYIGTNYQKKGFAGQALRLLFTHGFANLNLHQIWGETFLGNPAAHLFEKIGMKKDGLRRQFYWKDGKWVDCILYSVLAEEWSNVD